MPFPQNVRIVLVQPEYPGNVGSTARAMFTLGLSELYVVKPVCDPLGNEAFVLAHSAADVLRNVCVVERLEDALAGTVFSIGTTRRVRRVGYPTFNPEETIAQILARTVDQPVALVFGRESSGLNNEELALCSIHSTIPTATENHSLNLAQSVLIYCYLLHQASLAPADRTYQWKLATHVEMEHFFSHLGDTLTKLRTKPATTMERFIARFRRVIARMPLESRDVQLLHKLLHRVEEGIDRRGPD